MIHQQVEQFTLGVSQAKINPNNVPSAQCVYKSKSLELPGSGLKISQFDIWTTQRGNNKKAPQVSGFMQLRDAHTLRDTDRLIFSMDIQELGWKTDRFGKPKGIEEVSVRKNLEIGSSTYNIVMRRVVADVQSDEIKADMMIYSTDESTSLLLHARCQYKKP